MTTLPAYLDAVEQGRIPADEIAHETRLARTAFKEALAEAVRAEREAIASALARQVDTFDSSETTDYRDGWHMASRAALKMVRSRPSPDVAVVPQIFDERTFEHRFVVVAREMVAHHDDYTQLGDSSARFIEAMNACVDMAKTYPSSPPPDLAAMRRVVEAAERLYIASDQNPSAETDAFGNLLYAVAVYRGDEEVRAQEADHGR